MIHNSTLFLSSDENTIFDTSYRYKIPLPSIKKENKKGTIITKLENLDKFCRGIEMDENVFCKCIASKLSCSSGVNSPENYCFWKGDYPIQEILDSICFLIRSFLLCVQCDKPEIIISKKKQTLHQRCKACGHISPLQNNSKNDKIYQIFLKHVQTKI